MLIIVFTLFLQAFAHGHFLEKELFMPRNLQTTNCPKVTFLESYSTQYNASFGIQPTFSLSCTSSAYSIVSAQVDGNSAFYFNTATKTLVIQDWKQLTNNNFYNFTLLVTVANSTTQLTISDNFVLVVGTVNIQYSSMGYNSFTYLDSFTFDYSNAFDPYQPETGVLTMQWQCSGLFLTCSQMKKITSFEPYTLITSQRITFDQAYSFNVTLINSKLFKTVTDTFTFEVQSPERVFKPSSCIQFNLNFKDQAYAVSTISSQEVQIFFDNNNYTDIKITTPTISASNCASTFGIDSTKIGTLGFAHFNNTMLFDDQHSYQFNTSDIFISKAKILSSFQYVSKQQLTFYVYAYNTDNKQILGYQYKTLTLKLNDQSLYAYITQSFIQVDSNKILYVDGSTSYDARGNVASNINYTWTIEGFSKITLPNTKVLALTPDQRNSLGINQAGKYYKYSLTVKDSSRLSTPYNITIQITPAQDPNYCINVSMKDINITQVTTYTIWPLLLQAKVTRGTCANVVEGALVWSCSDISYQFWELILNNNTIGIDRDVLKKLPKSKNINMTVTKYYTINSIEYASRVTFTLLVGKPELILVLNYQPVINILKTSLVLDASKSYDPQAESASTTSIPVTCKWKCPPSFTDICRTGITLSNNGCTAAFSNIVIRQSSAYTYSILNQMSQFQISIFKDTRVTTSYVFVTITDSDKYPQCNISMSQSNSINDYQYLIAGCSTTNTLAYQWSLYDWSSLSFLSETQYLQNSNQVMRIPPYMLSAYSEIFVTLQATDGTYTTPIGYYLQSNNQANFSQGTINLNYNQFTSYLSNFIMTPKDWSSSLSNYLVFQYRIKESNTPFEQFKLLLAPVEASTNVPIQSILPPLPFDAAVYIDITDTLGNFITVRQNLVSKPNVLMTAVSFAVKVNTIIQNITYQFSEVDLENNVYRLRQYYHAYYSGYLDTQGQPTSFFKILSQSTIDYLYNTFMIDTRLNQVAQYDRRNLIRQHIIEILFFISAMHKDLDSAQLSEVYMITNQMVLSQNYTLAMGLADVSQKAALIPILLVDNSYNFLQDQIIKYVQSTMLAFLYNNEQLTATNGEYTMLVEKLPSSASNYPDISDFSYSKDLLSTKGQAGGMIFSMKNRTFMHIQLLDKSLNTVLLTSLSTPVEITFKLNSAQLLKYKAGNLSFWCASREAFNQAWSKTKISITSIDNSNGAIVCKANHFSQYTLFIVDTTPSPSQNTGGNTGTNSSNSTNGTVIDPTKLTNKTDDIVIDGKWNASIPNYTFVNYKAIEYLYDEQIIFQDKGVLMYLLSLLTIIGFLFSTLIIGIIYKNEHQRQEQLTEKFKFTIDPLQSQRKNRFRLFLKIITQFNPYLNLFMVYNQFLQRWVRNTMLQVYFMAIALCFGINQLSLSTNETYFNVLFNKLGRKNPIVLIAIFLLVLLIIVIIRPLAIRLFYKMLYEPYSRVDDYKLTTQQFTVKSQIQEPIEKGKQVDFEISNDRHDQYQLSRESISDQNFQVYLHDPMKNENSRTSFSGSKRLIDLRNSKVRFSQLPEKEEETTNEHEKSFLAQLNDNKVSSSGSVHDDEIFGTANNNQQMQALGSFDNRQGLLPQIPNKQNLGDFKSMINAFDVFEEINVEAQLNEDEEEQKNEEVILKRPSLLDTKNLVKESNKTRNEQQEEAKLQDRFSSIKKDTLIQDKEEAQISPKLKFKKDKTNSFSKKKQDIILADVDTVRQEQDPQDDENSNDGFNYLEQFYGKNPDLDDQDQQYEGGDKENDEKFQEQELERLDSIQDEAITHHQEIIDNQQTEFIREGGNNNRPFPSKLDRSLSRLQDQDHSLRKKASTDILNVENERSINDIQDGQINDEQQQNGPPKSEIMPTDKKVFVNKILGKVFLWIIWTALAIGNIICLSQMRYTQFKDWAILSVVLFVIIMIVTDPILYWILACVMIRGKQSERVEYYTRHKIRKDCGQIFVLVFIGKHKMRDLKRRLNPSNPL